MSDLGHRRPPRSAGSVRPPAATLTARAAARRRWLAAVGVGLAGVFAAPGKSLAGGWTDQRANNTFYCRANFSLRDHEPLLFELSHLQADLKQTLCVAPPRELIELYLFKDKRSYRDYLKLRFPEAPDRRALFIKGAGPGQVFVYLSDELAVDVRHESTHALLHAALPMVPLWLDEGIAEYFEAPAEERIYRKKYVSSLRWNLRFGKAPRLTVLEAKRDVEEMSANDYRDAWSWVHFMLHGPPAAREELLAFLSDIQASAAPGRLSERLERRLPELDEQWAQHFRSLKPTPALAARPLGSAPAAARTR